MARREPPTYTFTDPVQARDYLGEVARLWGLWMILFALVFLVDGVLLLLVAVGLLVGMIVLGKPFQERARAIADGDELVGNWVQVALGRGYERDQVVRDLAYREPAMISALAAAGLPPSLIWVRRLIVAVTIAGTIFVWVDLLSGGR